MSKRGRLSLKSELQEFLFVEPFCTSSISIPLENKAKHDPGVSPRVRHIYVDLPIGNANRGEKERPGRAKEWKVSCSHR